MHTITMNGTEYMQDTDGTIVEKTEYLRDLDEMTVNEFNTRAPDRLNSYDAPTTCKWCNTAYRQSELKEGCRCPYCWRLI